MTVLAGATRDALDDGKLSVVNIANKVTLFGRIAGANTHQNGDENDAGNYSVPTGKQLIIYRIRAMSEGAATKDIRSLMYGDNAFTGTTAPTNPVVMGHQSGEVIFHNVIAADNLDAGSSYDNFTWKVPAGKFVGLHMSADSASVVFELSGIEVDA